jgi:hypothetical protein
VTEQTCQPVSVSRTIHAPAEKLFSILTHTSNHPIIDGSGMVRDPLPDVKLSGVGDVFLMSMFNDRLGKYEMRNHVVEYEDDRRLVWEPVLAASSHPEAEIGIPARYRWGYELTPESSERTVVTETFDCTDSPEWLKEATQGGDNWIDAMTASLQNLEAIAAE